MRNIILILLLLSFQKFCFCQDRKIDLLKEKLTTAKADTAKLNIYLALGNNPNEKNILSFVEPAWDLLDKLFLKDNTEPLKNELIRMENELPDLVVSNYSYKDTIAWDKVLPYLNSRLQVIEKTGDKNRYAAYLYSMAHIYLDSKKDSAMFRTYLTKSIAIATAIKDSALIIHGYRYQCSFYWSAGNYAEAVEAIQSAITISKTLKYNKGLAASLADIADLYAEFGEEEPALKNYQASLDIAYKIRDTNQIRNTLIDLSDFYRGKNDPKKALEYLNRGLALNPANAKMDYNTGSLLGLIGEVYSDKEDYKNAMLNFEKNLRSSEAENDVSNTAKALAGIGALYNKQGDFSNALIYHTRALQLLDSMGNIGRYKAYKPVMHFMLALDNYGLKKYSEAKAYNDRALVDFQKIWFDIKTPSQMQLLAVQIDSAMGDGFGAYAHYKAYILLSEKIRGEDIRKEAQKDKFKAELDKQKAEQEKKDAIATRIRNLQYIVIGAFLLLGMFLMYGYVQKNKDKKRIEKAYRELKSTQAQLVQSEKMASLGELTAGIAHEIQNPLNFVNNFSEVSNELIDEMNIELDKGDINEAKAISSDIKQNLEKINHHGKRADAIVKGMLQHSQSSSGKKEPTNINKLADEYLRLAYHGLRAKDDSFNAILKTDFDESIGNINIVPQDIGRVILNLITNAFYAVDEKRRQTTDHGQPYEPTITIKTSATPPLGGGRAGFVSISVSDNGNGIPPAIIDKIFQPFFTTKPTGQATGLGLSLSYDIVKAHDGELKVETKENEGTLFTIQL